MVSIKFSLKLLKAFMEFPKTFKQVDPSSIYFFIAEDYVDNLFQLTQELLKRNKQGVIVTFDLRTRELSDKLRYQKINIEDNLFFVDCVSYASGQGSPPVFNAISLNKTNEFESLFYYTVMQLAKVTSDSTFVLIVAPHELLKYTDVNEIGLLFKWFRDRLVKIRVPIIFAYKENEDVILSQILTRLVYNRVTSIQTI